MRSGNINWDLIPYSHATNTYDLLLDVIKAIRAEPTRVAMNNYIQTPPEDLRNKPACGTQGCIAGWAALLKADHRKAKASWNLRDAFDGLSASVFAERKFIPTSLAEDWAELTLHNTKYPWPSSDLTAFGYAEAVVKNIERFMAEHERVLRAFDISGA